MKFYFNKLLWLLFIYQILNYIWCLCAYCINLFVLFKLVGLSFEVHDSYLIKYKQKDKKLDSKKKFKAIHEPSVVEVFHYAFCYIGILTGKWLDNMCTTWILFN